MVNKNTHLKFLILQPSHYYVLHCLVPVCWDEVARWSMMSSLRFVNRQEHSESADLHQRSSIPGLSKPTIGSSLSHFEHFMKISSKSVHNFSKLSFFKKILDPQDPDGDLDPFQNLTTSSFYHF